MKKFIQSSSKEQFKLSILVEFILDDTQGSIAAGTKIKPVVTDFYHKTRDDAAYSDFQTFVMNVWSMFDYYDFHIFDEYTYDSPSFPETSQYRWVAHNTEIESGNIPVLVQVRVSEHDQKLSEVVQKKVSKKLKEESDDLKLPATKKKQKYRVERITVNNTYFDAYEEALDHIEHLLRDWAESLGVDLTEYEPFNWLLLERVEANL